MNLHLQRYLGQLIFLVVSVALVLFITLIVFPLGKFSYQEVQKQWHLKRQYEQAAANVGSTDSLRNYYQTVVHKAQKARSALPSDSRSSHIVEMLLAGAKPLDLSLDDILSLDEVDHINHIEYPFELTIQGEFPALRQYLAALESQDMVLKMRNLDIQSEGMNKSRIDARVGLSVYVIKDK